MTPAFEIRNNLHWVGVKHQNLEIFDELFPTRNGSTYNAYLIQGSEKTVLIDTAKKLFQDEFLEKVKGLVPLDRIDAVVINHTEPDHSGSLGALLDVNPDLEVYCSRPAANFLTQIFNRPMNIKTVADGESLDLGGRTLQFILAPYLHWPDTMFTYLPEEKILFPCDGFGAHHCPAEGMYNDEVADFHEDFAHYFDTIMRPFKDKILEAIAKIDPLEIEMICPSHGPILREDPWAAVNDYRKWSTPEETSGVPKALVVVLSPHGNTRTMAGKVVEGLEQEGVEVELLSLVEAQPDELRAAYERNDALIVGTPTINRDAPPSVWNALALLTLSAPKGRTAAVFGSFGWSGEAVGLIEERLKGLKFNLAAEGLRYRFRPDENDLSQCTALGQKVALALLGQR